MVGPYRRISYEKLNARQKESYNFQHVSGILAEYGFTTIRLSDDWKGADFLAHHISGETLRIQLKSRLTFQKKYQGKDLWVCFPDIRQWYLYPHDEFLERVKNEGMIAGTVSWREAGGYSFRGLSKQLRTLLTPYRLER